MSQSEHRKSLATTEVSRMFDFLKKKKQPPPEEIISTQSSSNDPVQSSSLFSRLKQGLSRTRAKWSGGIASLFLGKKQIDAELLQALETQLLQADLGPETTQTIIQDLTARLERHQLQDGQALWEALQENLTQLLKPVETLPWQITHPRENPFIILMVGINGAGKTTTIGKLTQWLMHEKLSVLLAAGDTFRAAAIEQLQAWGRAHLVPVIAQQQGADSASVIFDAITAAKARGVDVVIADTAGRLHTQSNLLEELKKVKRVIQKVIPNAPDEIVLVLDAGIGQNAIRQVEEFHQAIGLTSLIITKLDGTAKGGIIFSLAKRLGLPIRFIGVGEKASDLAPFDAKTFVSALLYTQSESSCG